ncbi:hypothetical protein CSA17_06815 [bacterium DOLJORAL78_65_58]|nr:MAG: hypothetical protein CSB20_12520 [bacterium DOLZORAL124_64_63]PIE75562.1 MAG: hypothetical protein CSA17_06815 [bacterium DOLJORAL78_65_58]
MKKMLTLSLILMLSLTLLPLAGCGDGGGEKDQQSEVAATHDCDGGCGMKDAPVDQLTKVDGKYYCASCAEKAKAGDHSHDDNNHGDHSHDSY